MIFAIVQIILYLLGCFILFMTLYDHYVNKEPIIAALKKWIQRIFLNGCIGQSVIVIVIAAFFFLLYTLLFDNSLF